MIIACDHNGYNLRIIFDTCKDGKLFYYNLCVNPIHMPWRFKSRSTIINILCLFHLQAILKRSLKPTCSILPLMKRGHVNNLEFFLSHVGKIHMNGLVFMLFIPKLFFF